MGRGGQGTRSKAQGREDWTWNFGLGRRRKALQKEEPLVRKTVFGEGQGQGRDWQTGEGRGRFTLLDCFSRRTLSALHGTPGHREGVGAPLLSEVA